MSTPSAGALRATQEFFRKYTATHKGQLVITQGGLNGLAEIIDRESGLAELLEAANNIQCGCTPRERDSGHKLDCWFPVLQEAINKATKP